MTTYTPPVADMQYILHEVLQISQQDLPGYADLEPEFTEAVLDAAGKLASEVLAPLNAVGDRQGCRLENGVVRTPDGFKAAFDQMREGGWTALDCDPEYGGQGMPYVIGLAAGEMFSGANMAFTMYQGLTHGAYSAIHAHGTEAQKALYLPRMVSCEWTGTMNLTEPHCGTDLGLLRTRAEPQDDGSYLITGQKIFISAGDHDMSENVIHLVLAKAPGGGEGTRGISLFIVPKFLVNDDGTLGEANALSVGKLEEKMGIHGNATCVMNYDGARGWLLGDLHKGMRAMFTMMNEARIGVGLQGYAVAEAAYQNAVAYAKDRLQGRAVTGNANPSGPADPLIVHPDIRRNLMDQKSFLEGARALALWGAHLIDRSHLGQDKAAEDLVSLLTPVIKGFLTDKGFDCTVQAQQVYGGHGYIEEQGMSQFVRDSRIAMIYEGANGVQALDLVGRKLAAEGGKPIMAFFDLVKQTVKAHEDDPMLGADFCAPLKAASKDLQAAAMVFMEQGMKNPNAALAGSYDFMHLFGHVALGLMWTRMAAAAAKALAEGRGDPGFYETKLATGRYYMSRQLPATALHLARIRTGAQPVMALEADRF
ncbi:MULTISPECIES: acyl-CoA dehydrogenase C-terminal domain-containing protein [unclassified Paracoccus (in: a-proteobacteria)]|uniref:acyl-CoA dehydrogenase C-terminal domain-containing protein n=1 Tax=unclassified Paracoccus (in: a-proteobacteria) TaxID=2688777 RepID=UPI0012B1D217|nr:MULTISPECIES: acyl-CoA dehydrogenase C-terminal domain-containing protein [unclassified Paracoccus (in: a-proteobacteria)]UXU74949.1 acyl-CoA dehydrogenase C-terminal domain-containing protein [Paracoccus sp. SMMA_5]UXU80852.1 acyl-CoA dehydrogenase C-terminal domain-containing protein [Paracoccus sp. SMMA_5_TC]